MDAEKLVAALSLEEAQEIARALPVDVLASEFARRAHELSDAAATVAVAGTTETSDAASAGADDGTHGDGEAQPSSPEAIKAQIESQLGRSVQVYEGMMSSLNAELDESDQFLVADREAIAEEFAAWLTEDKLNYIQAAIEANPLQGFVLTITPNSPVEPDEVIMLAETFGESQPLHSEVQPGIYRKYDEQQLSGYADDGKRVKFALISDRIAPELTDQVTGQRATLENMQRAHPFLRVQTVLEDIAYVEAIRLDAQSADAEAELVGEDMPYFTYSRHFDLPKKAVGMHTGVPYSVISADGSFHFGYSKVTDTAVYGHVAIG